MNWHLLTLSHITLKSSVDEFLKHCFLNISFPINPMTPLLLFSVTSAHVLYSSISCAGTGLNCTESVVVQLQSGTGVVDQDNRVMIFCSTNYSPKSSIQKQIQASEKYKKFHRIRNFPKRIHLQKCKGSLTSASLGLPLPPI